METLTSASGPHPDVVTAVVHLNAGKYFQIAAVIVLFYDHILTFSEEVERIWKQRISGASILFLLNRYGNLLSFTVIVNAFNDGSWTPEVCKRFAPFEGAQSLVFIAICELVMILRVYALYGRSTPILVFLMVLWCLQVSMSGVGISTGNAVMLPPGLVGCILVGTNPLFPVLWVAPLVTDTCIFTLTLYRLRPFTRRVGGNTPMIQIFIRDGVMYFLAIFTANLINCLIYFIAPEDLRALGASFSQVLTSVMVSRLVLNLRSLREQSDERLITRSIEFGNGGIPRTGTAVQFQATPRGNISYTYGSGVASGWTDETTNGHAGTGEDGTISEWRESRGFWGGLSLTGSSTNALASGTGAVNFFMAAAIGNLGEEFEDDKKRDKNGGDVQSRRSGKWADRWGDGNTTELRVFEREAGCMTR